MKYIIRFLTPEGDIVTEWAEGNSDSEAIDLLIEKNLNVKEILSVIEV